MAAEWSRAHGRARQTRLKEDYERADALRSTIRAAGYEPEALLEAPRPMVVRGGREAPTVVRGGRRPPPRGVSEAALPPSVSRPSESTVTVSSPPIKVSPPTSFEAAHNVAASAFTCSSLPLRANSDEDAMPVQFFCPITHNLMVDPVFTADGHTYERQVIAEWLATRDTSPLTNEVLAHKHLTPNVALRTLISEHVPLLPSLHESSTGTWPTSSPPAGPQPALPPPPLPLHAPLQPLPPLPPLQPQLDRVDLLATHLAPSTQPAPQSFSQPAPVVVPVSPSATRGRGGRGGRGAGRGTGKLIAPVLQ